MMLALALVADTLRIAVGAPSVNATFMEPHRARVIVERQVGNGWEVSAEWINELTLGDSAGKRVQRWVTTGTRQMPGGGQIKWQILQTYDHTTLAMYGYYYTSSAGADIRLSMDGPRIRGKRKTPSDAAHSDVDITLSEAAYYAGASDLPPVAAGLAEGKVMIMPVWQPGMQQIERRTFTVTGRKEVKAGDTTWNAWVVEERAMRGGTVLLLATWYMTDKAPYMVYAEQTLQDGTRQRITEFLIP
jgi:hypothetical protein